MFKRAINRITRLAYFVVDAVPNPLPMTGSLPITPEPYLGEKLDPHLRPRRKRPSLAGKVKDKLLKTRSFRTRPSKLGLPSDQQER